MPITQRSYDAAAPALAEKSQIDFPHSNTCIMCLTEQGQLCQATAAVNQDWWAQKQPKADLTADLTTNKHFKKSLKPHASLVFMNGLALQKITLGEWFFPNFKPNQIITQR